jgi:hypothetical protein
MGRANQEPDHGPTDSILHSPPPCHRCYPFISHNHSKSKRIALICWKRYHVRDTFMLVTASRATETVAQSHTPVKNEYAAHPKGTTTARHDNWNGQSKNSRRSIDSSLSDHCNMALAANQSLVGVLPSLFVSSCHSVFRLQVPNMGRGRCQTLQFRITFRARTL